MFRSLILAVAILLADCLGADEVDAFIRKAESAKQQWAAEFKVAMMSPNVDVQIQGWVRFKNANGFVGITRDRLLELIGKPANGTVTATDDYILIRLEETVGHAGREDKRETWLTWNIVTILSKQKTVVATVILDGNPPLNLEAVVRALREGG